VTLVRQGSINQKERHKQERLQQISHKVNSYHKQKSSVSAKKSVDYTRSYSSSPTQRQMFVSESTPVLLPGASQRDNQINNMEAELAKVMNDIMEQRKDRE